MTKEDLLSRIKEGQSDFKGCDFSGENLDGLELDGPTILITVANFTGASIRNARLSRLNLSGSDFTGTDLSGTTLESCVMIGVSLYNAKCVSIKFIGGNLEDSSLINTNFSNSLLISVNFTNATIFNTDFSGTGLGLVNNIDKIIVAEIPEHIKSHIPANFRLNKIDMDCIEETAAMQVLLASETNLNTTKPSDFIVFLEKNGISRVFIKAYESILNTDKDKFQSVFISYSTSDNSFADILYNALRKSGVKAWYAPKDMIGGKTIIEQLNIAIKSSDRVLIVLSENSIKSKWVLTEISNAYSREQSDSKRVLFPISITKFDTIKNWILFDSDEGTDLAKYIRSYFIPDFSKWQSETEFDNSLQKLIQALKLEE